MSIRWLKTCSNSSKSRFLENIETFFIENNDISEISSTFAYQKNMNMKTIRKKILTLAMILASVNASGRQAHFMMSAFGQGVNANYTCNVTAKFENGKFMHYTGCTIFPHTKTPNAKVRVSIDAEEIPRFVDFLTKVRDKYAEWDSIAHAGKVTSFTKRMPVELKSQGGIWSIYYVDNKPPRSTFDMNKKWEYLIPFFSVDQNGNSRVEWSTSKLEYSARGGQFGLGNTVEIERCGGGEFAFTSVKEIQSLIDCFDVGLLADDCRENKSMLFQ
jgi:hypothetical protein